MGEPVSVIEKPSHLDDYYNFETNRSFTGMGHESYSIDEPILKDRFVDKLAQALFDTNLVSEVHIYAQTITVKLKPSVKDVEPVKQVIEDFCLYYK